MSFEVVALIEFKTAKVTLVRLLAGVHHHVALDVGRSTEGLAAIRACSLAA